MSKRFTQSDIDNLRHKGLRVVDAGAGGAKKPAAKPQHTIPASFALGRLKAGNMNKTESAYHQYLEALKAAGEVEWFAFEPINLKLADKCFYRVDFLVMIKGGLLECHEVKGYWAEDALVKIKTAAAKFPFRFKAVKLVKGKWEVREF